MIYFNDQHVADASAVIKNATEQFEQLFNLLAKQIYHESISRSSSSEVMAIVYQYIEEAEQAFKSHFDENPTLACGKGCNHCCAFPIQLMPQDLEHFLTQLIKEHSYEQLIDVLSKLKQQQAAKKPPFYRAPCAFLDQEGACTVYEYRPLACRMFTSLDAQSCQRSLTNGSAISQSTIRYRIFQAATCALQVINQTQKRPDKQVDFTEGLIMKLVAFLEVEAKERKSKDRGDV